MSRVDTVERVAFYPLKGGHAATVDGDVPRSLAVGRTGFKAHDVVDRDFVLFDTNAGCFVSQRGWGSRGKKVVYPQDRKLATVRMDVRQGHIAVVSKAGQVALPSALAEGKKRDIEIFGKKFPVVEQSKEASDYFSRLLERELLLVRADRDIPRELPEKYQREGAFNIVAGADGMPFLLTSQESLRAMHVRNGMDAGTIPIDRYRGNIILEGIGLGAFGEDYIDTEQQFRIGEIGLWVVKACSRCPVPDIDQESGELNGGALRVLRGRTGSIFTGEEGVFFGQNVIHANEGIISVGDPVVVDFMSPTPNIAFREAA